MKLRMLREQIAGRVSSPSVDLEDETDSLGNDLPSKAKRADSKDGKDRKDKNKDQNGEEEKDDAPTRLRRMLQFRQYMRNENVEDRELMEEFAEKIDDVGEEWEREDHLDELRPSVWFRKGEHVVEVFASLGVISATFGHFPKETEEKISVEEDYPIVTPIFPSVVIPHEVENEDTGELETSFENALEKLQEFVEECDDYLSKTEQDEEGEEGTAEAPRKSRGSSEKEVQKDEQNEEP